MREFDVIPLTREKGYLLLVMHYRGVTLYRHHNKALARKETCQGQSFELVSPVLYRTNKSVSMILCVVRPKSR
jgi:hypothetical protein